MKKYILALDQGTTSSRAIVLDYSGAIVSVGRNEFTQYYPQPGWVEHDASEIWTSQKNAIDSALTGIAVDEIAAIGITNQRETTILWERATGNPVHMAIVWQCRRTAAICEDLKSQGLEEYVRRTTGLIIDAYFSATKIKWILDSFPDIRRRADNGEICFGTVDSWLLFKLTDGKVHATDFTNASRTMLYDIHMLDWDEKILNVLGIPRCILPKVMDTSGYFGSANIAGREIPVMSMVGDQQAALFGQTCFEPGNVKNTYGTGCFILCNTGEIPVESNHGLLTTIGYRFGGRTTYALEGSVFNSGAAVQWMRDELKIIHSSSDADTLAATVPDSGGVYVVPAFTGLGTPYWDMYARGAVLGLTRGSSDAHIARAVLEGIAYLSMDVIDAMKTDSGMDMTSLWADGGASNSDIIMQFQADILGITVKRPMNIESTALGAGYLAGLAAGVWSGLSELKSLHTVSSEFTPHIGREERERLRRGWAKAVKCTLGWARED